MLKKSVTTIAATAGLMAAFADTSTNTSANGTVTPEIKNPWKQSVTAGLTLTSGNSDSLLATIKYLADKKTAINEFTFDADGGYGKANDVQSVGFVHGFAQLNHLFSERAYGYGRIEGLHDDIAEVTYRFTGTVGAGYYLIKEVNTSLSTEVGPGVVTQKLEYDDPHTYATLRIGEKFEHKFAPGTRIWQTAEILPQVDRVQNYIVNLELGAEAAFSKSLSLSVVLDDTYNSEPANSLKRNDVKLVSGITYRF
jgi:putative salt-induced outer membrane protein YdiY